MSCHFQLYEPNSTNNGYTLEGVSGEFSREELQPINKDDLMKSKIRVEKKMIVMKKLKIKLKATQLLKFVQRERGDQTKYTCNIENVLIKTITHLVTS